ncbi:MAG: hypothetical protein ABIR32_23045 [Ilumatobacteraceae bacterium]
MLHPDPRAYRVALVADAIVNEGAAGYDAVALLDDAAFGVVVLPPSDFTVSTIGSIVEYVIDDLVDYRNKGYAIVVVGSTRLPQFGVWSDHVDAETTHRGIDPFDRFDVDGTTEADLVAFLSAAVPSAVRT